MLLRTLIISGGCCLALLTHVASLSAQHILWRAKTESDLEGLSARSVELTLKSDNTQTPVHMRAGRDDAWPGVTFRPPNTLWDLSKYSYLEVHVRNVGAQTVHVGFRTDSIAKDDKRLQITASVDLQPGAATTISLPLTRKVPAHLEGRLFGMRGYPALLNPEKGIDPSRVDQIILFVTKQAHEQAIQFGAIQAVGSYEGGIWTDPTAEAFPMIDRFGQYRHATWPGKTNSVEDLEQAKAEESADLQRSPGPPGRNRYGGWTGGPQLDATGHFRAQKVGSKWWLVDPEGRLFWSHGIDCVRATTAYTPVTDREFYFAELPQDGTPLAQFYGFGSWAPHGYYQDKGRYRTFNWTGANLYRKYGEDWATAHRELCHRRLRSWGLNTIANWSDAEVYRQKKTAYVVTVGSGRKPIEGSTGYWGKFPDPFDPDFLEAARRNTQARQADANSAWCIGVFVDNELAWGDETSLAVAALASPPEQAAKRQFVADLRTKYHSIESLNEVWKSDHANWDALLQTQTPPDKNAARDDLEAFYSRIAEKYFEVCRSAVKEVAPNALYLGCRFAWVNDRAVLAAGKYCDVIGYNKYTYSIADFDLPGELDLPTIVGEFHFGALDRGMFHTGLKPTANQQERADRYRDYVRGALQNPHWVGTHWFQFGDQATTGRGDGENYQIGFLDVCDRPYPETVQACRDVAADMYQLRWQPQ